MTSSQRLVRNNHGETSHQFAQGHRPAAPPPAPRARRRARGAHCARCDAWNCAPVGAAGALTPGPTVTGASAQQAVLNGARISTLRVIGFSLAPYGRYDDGDCAAWWYRRCSPSAPLLHSAHARPRQHQFAGTWLPLPLPLLSSLLRAEGVLHDLVASSGVIALRARVPH